MKFWISDQYEYHFGTLTLYIYQCFGITHKFCSLCFRFLWSCWLSFYLYILFVISFRYGLNLLKCLESKWGRWFPFDYYSYIIIFNQLIIIIITRFSILYISEIMLENYYGTLNICTSIGTHENWNAFVCNILVQEHKKFKRN